MALLTIGSNNPNFSHILSKNPATIAESKKPFVKMVRRGVAYGWYMTNGDFRLHFKDHPHEVSYPMDDANPEFEYLDRTRYGHPFLMNSLISECLSTASKKRHELDIDIHDSARLQTTVEVRSKSMAGHLPRMYTEFEKGRTFTMDHIAGNAYVMTITGNSVYQVLNTAIIASILFCTSDPTIYTDLRDNIIDKYARGLNGSDAPYFVRYLFNRNVFSNKQTFKKNKAQLDAPGMDFAFGDTHRQRMEYVFPALRENKKATKLHEIGTGEGRYTQKLVLSYDQVIGWEPLEEMREKVVGKLTARGIANNLTVNEALTSEMVRENPEQFTDADILVTEVFEHIEFEEATELLKALMETKFSNMVVTVPNFEFNQLYKLEQKYRHDDHKWEPTEEEFKNWVTSVWSQTTKRVATLEFTAIGDKVTLEDGRIVTPSLGFTLTNHSTDE